MNTNDPRPPAPSRVPPGSGAVPPDAARWSPTGEQWTIGHGRYELVVTEVGATIRSYTVGSRAVLDGFDAHQWSHGGRGQVLAPWPNRLGDGRYTFGNIDCQAALDEPAKGNAIHGLVRWRPWSLESRAQNRLAVHCVLHPSPGYPFTLELGLVFQLGRDGLTVTARATNRDDGPVPFGIGFHPYLGVPSGLVDVTRLRIPATQRLVLDQRGLPTGERVALSGSGDDFLDGRTVGTTQLDTAFTGLRRDADGLARAVLEDPGGEWRSELWVDRSYPYLMCYTGDTLAEPERRRAVAVEPMSCPPDALRTGDDLVVLEPGGSWEGRWGIVATS